MQRNFPVRKNQSKGFSRLDEFSAEKQILSSFFGDLNKVKHSLGDEVGWLALTRLWQIIFPARLIRQKGKPQVGHIMRQR